MFFRTGTRRVAVWGLLMLCISASFAQSQNVRVEDWVSVVIDNKPPLTERGAVIAGKTYLPLNRMAGELAFTATYDGTTKTVNVATGTSKVVELQNEVDKLKTDVAAAQGQTATLQGQNERLQKLVETANFFSFNVRCIGRSWDYNEAQTRDKNQYIGIVTFCGQDLFVIPPIRGGGNDASGVNRAKEISETLNEIFSNSNVALTPEDFAQTTTGTTGARFGITYRNPAGGDRLICDVDPTYAKSIYNWLKGQERALELPATRRLKTTQQAEELVRDWWLAELRDIVSLLRCKEYLHATTTAGKDAGEIFKTVLGTRLQRNYPLSEGMVSYQPLAVMNILASLTPEEKLKTFDIFHEGGLIAYFSTTWTPS